MKSPKVLTPIQTLVAVAVFNTACSNLPEGPGFSFTSKDNRLAGTWTVNDIDDLDQADILANIENIEFEKEGDYKAEFSDIQFSYFGYTVTITVETEGEWEWNSDKTEIEIDAVRTNTLTLFGTPQTTEEDYTLEFEVLRLSDEELFVEDGNGRRWELEKD